MKKEWLVQLIAFFLYYLNYITDLYKGEWMVSDTLGRDFVLVCYHAVLFLIVNYVLIPKLFYAKKYLLFFVAVFLLIIFFGIVEEGVWEQILYPNSRGANSVNLQAVYYYFGEVMVPLLSFVAIKFLFDNLENQQKLELIEKDNLSNELKFLKSQIQPHILFNSLNNLYEYTLAKSDKAPELVLQLSNVLRYILYETKTDLVPLSKELTFVNEFIALHTVQLEGRGLVQFDLQKDSTNKDLKIAPFLLVPFIENAFKHSLATKVEGIDIKIDIVIQGKTLKMCTENNFEEHSAAYKSLVTKGVGLNNVQKRLTLLYPDRHHLIINDKDNQYKVLLELILE